MGVPAATALASTRGEYARDLLQLSLLALVACNDEPKVGNGVNDVRASCEIRAKFNRANDKCDVCEAAVVSTRCECVELAPVSAACMEQENARKPVCRR